MPDTDLTSAWREICTRAWSDEEFKTRLLDSPDEVLGEFEFSPPPGMSYRVIEGRDNEVVLVLPADPQSPGLAGAADHTAVSQYYASCL